MKVLITGANGSLGCYLTQYAENIGLFVIPTSIKEATARGTNNSKVASNNLKRGPKTLSFSYPFKNVSNFLIITLQAVILLPATPAV